MSKRGLSASQREWRREYSREYQADLRKWRKEHHLCTNCGGSDAYTMVGRKMCAECREKANELGSNHYNRNKEEINERRKLIREERKGKGLCICCGKNKAEEGKASCGVCLSKRRNRRERNLSRLEEEGELVFERPRDKSLWPELGLCSKCGKPLDGAIVKFSSSQKYSKLCKSCYENAVKAAAAGREALKEKHGTKDCSKIWGWA